MTKLIDAKQPSLSNAGPAAVLNPGLQRVALLAASLWLAGSLAGCGGGGGGGATAAPPAPLAPAPTPTPAPAPAPGALSAGNYLVAGITSSESTGHRLVVADAEAGRAEPVLSVPVQGSTQMMSTVSYTDDPTSRAVVLGGSPLTFYVTGSQLWQIDLASSRTPTSQRISSLNNVCEVQMVAPLDASGLDAWVLVGTAGADGDCSARADNRQAFVRSGTPAATAPFSVPAAMQVQPLYLTGERGALWWMLALDNSSAVPRLMAYGPTLNVVEVTGGSGITTLDTQGQGTYAGEGTYVRTGADLRRILASATALSIGQPQLRFTGASSLTLYQRPAMYFADENIVYRVEGGGSPTAVVQLDANAGPAVLLAQSADKLLLRQGAVLGKRVVSAVDKRTGSVTPLLTQADVLSNAIWAMRGETVFYFTGNIIRPGALRRIELDGSGDAQVATNLLILGRITSRLSNLGETTAIGSASALLACQPLPGNSDCRGSTLLQIDLATRGITTLGSFASSTATSWFAQGGTAYEGVKGAVVEVQSGSVGTGSSFTRKDLYVFNPGEANSLKLVSPTTP